MASLYSIILLFPSSSPGLSLFHPPSLAPSPSPLSLSLPLSRSPHSLAPPSYYLVTEGLAAKHAPRVRDFPPDETALLGVGVGYAQMGLLPIVEIPYAKVGYGTGGGLNTGG